MPDFNKGSTFNKDANFQGVKFGADAPLLETELNELQDIQTEARAEIIRDSIPSGFVKLGELDYDYMLNNENCVKLKTDSVAYVNGYKILIPKDTIVDIGKAPEKDAREDLLFLEVWKEEVTKDSILTVAGGEGQAQISNTILDDRIGQETARRIALKWRIRHVSNVDFKTFPQGLGYYNNSTRNLQVQAQGGNTEPLNYNSDTMSFVRISAFKSINDRINYPTGNNQLDDTGVFLAGSGDIHSSKNLLKSLDGYVYGIPMFRLYRKPSCGKAIPFEYQKINPKVDYSKFTDLMKEERVERVVNETIQGQSLVNLLPPVSEFGGVGITNLGNNTVKLTQTGTTEYFQKRGLNFKNNTVYTFIYTIVESTVVDNSFCIVGDSDENILDAIHQISSKVGVNCYSFTSSNTNINPSKFRLAINSIATEGTYVIFKDIMLLEGDWTNKEIPQYFTGLKSLGEDEGNLITVKNAILNESSYDPDTGTPKLNTVSGANYITSDNLIMPTIEGQVKRGEEKLSDLNAFGKVDNLVGDEKVDFTKIKGRTLQNLVTSIDSIIGVTETTIVDRTTYWDLTKTSTQLKANITLNAITNLFKPSTKYTLILKNVHSVNDTFCIYDRTSKSILAGYSPNKVQTFTTKTEVGKILLYINNDVDTSTKLYKDFIILEGDYSNTPLDELPFIEGIKSVGENEVTENGKYRVKVKNCGKNLLDISKCTYGKRINETTGGIMNPSSYTGDGYTNYIKIDLNVSEQIQFSCGNKPQYTPWACYDENKNYIKGSSGTNTGILPNNTKYIRFTVSSTSTNEMLEYGTVATDYEPYKEYKQEITLKEPLRSLPNGVCDEIVGNKVIRRIGKIVLDESTVNNYIFTINSVGETVNSKVFALIPSSDMNYKSSSKNGYCDTLSVLNTITSDNVQHVYLGQNINFRILNTNLSSVDVEGFKTWLSQNPTTVYYELATPIEEPIEPNYDKESIKTYQLDEPLRSLPNGVCDTIEGNKVIRRISYAILGNDEVDYWNRYASGNNDTETTMLFALNYSKLRDRKAGYNNIMCYNLACIEGVEIIYPEGIFAHPSQGYNSYVYIRINKNKLPTQDLSGFKAWLLQNPTTIYYELATPIEIPLKEVLPSKADFSLERQFKYSDNYLLELPNGVKDTVENGKVTRRVKKIVLNGSEDWADSSSLVLANTIGFRVIPSDKKVNTEIFCDKFKYVHHNSLTTLDEEFITGQGTTSQVYIRIAKSRLSSPDLTGFKAWLSNNPVTIIYELNTPTIEELSGNNNRYCPYHEEDNTYCGSLYVGDGTNNVLVENGLKNENVIIDTPFRSITDKEVVTDCKYKKSVDGYDNMYITSNSKNLFNGNITKGDISTNTGLVSDGYNIISADFTPVLPNTLYTLWRSRYDSNSIGMRYYDKYFNYLGSSVGINTGQLGSFKTPDKCRYVKFKDLASGDEYLTTKYHIELGESFISYEDFILTEKAFENTEENDIEDLRHLTSLVGFNYEQMLNKSFDSLLRGEL